MQKILELSTVYLGMGLKGKQPKIVVDWYIFAMHRRVGLRTRWRCSNCNKTKCRAFLNTYGNVVNVIWEHNHPPTADQGFVAKMSPRMFHVRRMRDKMSRIC